MSVWGGSYGGAIVQGITNKQANKDADRAYKTAQAWQQMLNPQLPIIQELFGAHPVYNKSGTRIIRYDTGSIPIYGKKGNILGYEGPAGGSIFSDPKAVPDSQLSPLQRTIRGFIYGGKGHEFVGDYPRNLTQAAVDAYYDPSKGPLGAILPDALDAAHTGFRTDMSPIIAEEQRRYRDETLPLLKEQFAPATGLFATDFLGAGEREGAAMGSRLGAQQVELDEAASARRLQGIPLYSALFQANTAIPLNLASDVYSLGNQLDPGARLLNFLGSASTLAQGTSAVQAGYPTGTGGGGSAGAVGALGSLIPGLVKAGTSLWDYFTTPNQPAYDASSLYSNLGSQLGGESLADTYTSWNNSGAAGSTGSAGNSSWDLFGSLGL